MRLAKYNQTKTIDLDLYQIDGIDLEPGAPFEVAEVKISKDGGAEVNKTN